MSIVPYWSLGGGRGGWVIYHLCKFRDEGLVGDAGT